ncbi:MAG: DUF1851 domain-containing protein [Deltaproteobacteria bacterium]|nr:DUF1851 domain-containing protein [Deltaproteobacteria bacterium]
MHTLLLRELTAQLMEFPEPNSLMDAWRWLFPSPLRLQRITLMGDAFLVADDDTVFFLDATRGTLEQIATSPSSLRQLMAERWFKERYFHAEKVSQLQQLGKEAAQGECFTYTLPLALGGKDELANLVNTPLSTHFGLLGHLHKKESVEKGTKLTSVV